MWHSLWYNNRLLCFVLQIGTYQMALCSKAHNKPFYVVAESFKFVRLYPLNQQDVPDKFKVKLYRFSFSPPYFRFRSFPYISILGLNSTKQTPWRLQRTCQKNIQLLITHLPPSSPSSSLTWESLPHLQSAMNSSNFIYNCFTILQ